nr:outer membrane protein assembly factor BamA [Sphingomicrobium nitratireducens]
MNNFNRVRRAGAGLLVGTILGGIAVTPALAQEVDATAPTATAQPVVAREGQIRSLLVTGAERIERETVLSYSGLQPGQTYTARDLDAALKKLYDTELFADVVITGADTGNIVVAVQENPVINRIVIEGNKKLKDDKIEPEIRLAPRQIFTRTKVRADVDRIIELYKREGRFAAVVEPKIVELDQNRVDLIFEISEGAKSKIRQINFIGNDAFSGGKLQKEIFSRESGGFLGFMKSNDAYDADRLAADQQKLRAFYLTQGYADFRVVNALAELTPDREDFVITFVIEEGPRYKFGTLDVESDIRDLAEERLEAAVGLTEGDWFDAEAVENTVNRFTEIAGLRGYAFAQVNPKYYRDAEEKTVSITFEIEGTPRVYIDRVDIQGNTVTRDAVIRRELRLAEGDPFNAQQIKRSEDRIKGLGYFQEELEIKQTPVGEDRVALTVDVDEKATGELQLSAGYSSIERFVVAASIAQRNFMGKGQQLSAGVNWSRYTKSVQLGFVEPYLGGRNILLGGDLYRRDYNSFRFVGNDRRTTYKQVSTGGGLRVGFPVTEYLSAGMRYRLVLDDITLDRDVFFTDGLALDANDPNFPNVANGVFDDFECDPLKAGAFLCNELGSRLTSSIGYSLGFNNTDGIRATRGLRAQISQDFAGLGGDVKYLRTVADATKYFRLPANFILSINAQGGYIHPLEDNGVAGLDDIRLTDRFFGPNVRGFDIRGIGPRVQRVPYDIEGNLNFESARTNNALGGKAYYMGRLEVEFPVSAAVRSFGLRPSAYVDVASVWNLESPQLINIGIICTPRRDAFPDAQPETKGPGETCGNATYGPEAYIGSSGFREFFLGNSPSPRVAVGVGVNWVSPFGPLRIDLAKAIVSQEGDDTKLFSFNVGTQF